MNTQSTIAQLTGIILNYEEKLQELKARNEELSNELDAALAKKSNVADVMNLFSQILPVGVQLLQNIQKEGHSAPQESQRYSHEHYSYNIMRQLAADLKTLSGEAVKAIVDKLNGDITAIPVELLHELRAKHQNTRWFLDSLLGVDFWKFGSTHEDNDAAKASPCGCGNNTPEFIADKSDIDAIIDAIAVDSDAPHIFDIANQGVPNANAADASTDDASTGILPHEQKMYGRRESR